MWPIGHNLKHLLIAIDQFGNVVISTTLLPWQKAWADETLSAHCHRWRMNGVKWPACIVDAIAWVFGDKDHCRASFESEQDGRQLPPEARAERRK